MINVIKESLQSCYNIENNKMMKFFSRARMCQCLNIHIQKLSQVMVRTQTTMAHLKMHISRDIKMVLYFF